MSEVSENAMHGIMLRNLAPALRQWFEWYSVKHGVPFHQVYLTARYKPDQDMDDPKSALVELRNFEGKGEVENIQAAQAASGTSEMTLLQQMFPLLKDHVLKQAEQWNVSKYRVFLMACYLVGKDISSADSIDLQFRCRVPGGKDLAKRIE